jgi:hypothetical protein
LAKRGEQGQGQGQAKREWCVDCFHVAQIVVAVYSSRMGLNCTVRVFGKTNKKIPQP